MQMVLSNPVIIAIIFFVFLPAVILSQPLAPPPPVIITPPPLQPALFRVIHVAQGVGPLTVKVSNAAATALNIPAVAFRSATRFFVATNFPPSNLRNSATTSVITAAGAANNATGVLLLSVITSSNAELQAQCAVRLSDPYQFEVVTGIALTYR